MRNLEYDKFLFLLSHRIDNTELSILGNTWFFSLNNKYNYNIWRDSRHGMEWVAGEYQPGSLSANKWTNNLNSRDAAINWCVKRWLKNV